ncbi:MAG: response regulator [Ramlibacter sp.]|nr:response regulator [Ramlibacter sp.]
MGAPPPIDRSPAPAAPTLSLMTADPAETSGFPIVGVGASAGGLEAFTQLLKALPEHTGMAFVLIQHLGPTYESRLADLLGKTTRMPVLEAAQGLAVQPDHVYVIVPNTTLTLAAEGMLHVEPRGEGRGPHLPVDHFFKSLAEHRQSGAIGVVLSGTGSDGTLGIEQIKACGGFTFAQDDASAKQAGMPQSAFLSGCIDRVLPPDRIAHELARIGRHPYMEPTPGNDPAGAPAAGDGDESSFKAVLALLRVSSGVDFSAYRDTTIKRRIVRRLMLHGGPNLAHYIDRLRGDRAELDALYNDLLINVTSFFREAEVFEQLKRRVFPDILASKRPDAPIRIWVPGCSTGQEPYSLAMALLEFLDDKPLRPPIQVFATDLSDSVALHKARAGLYPESITAEVSPGRLSRFFQKEDGHYRISKTLREIVVFAKQNVAADPPFSRLDLISCRNLLIYLSPALQKRVIPTFHYALNPGGFLLLGAAETIGAHIDLFDAVDPPQRIYARKSAAARSYPHFRSDDNQARLAGRDHGGSPARPQAADWQREADRVAAGQYVPPGVLINHDFDILQFRGETGPFLTPPAGDPSHNLLKMAREGLFLVLRSAVHECQQTGAAVRHPDVRVRGEGVDREIELHVMPVKLPHTGERCYLILFEERMRRVTPPAAPPGEPALPADAAELHHVRQELASTREYLQSVIEQQDTASEELKSSSEELLSSNEELQSTNEELETAKEELQSINEELTTVNEQLQSRNGELARLNDDMTNLIGSSGVPTLVLGVDLRIRRFTPAAARLLQLVAADVGRPLGNVKHGIELPDLEAISAGVIASVEMTEREVRGPDGRSWLLRLHPYRTADNRIDGVVLVLLDIDAVKSAQDALQVARDYAQAIVDTVRETLLVLDAQLKVRSANQAFYTMFQVTPQEIEGRQLFELDNRQWDIPALRDRLGDVLSRSLPFADFEVRRDSESIGPKVMRLNARRIPGDGERSELILLAIEDHTDIDRLEGQERQHIAQLVDDSQQKLTFLALLAHELRNPLAPIRNALHILGRIGNPGEQELRMRAMIERQITQLTRLVDDLLDVARINRGQIEVRKQPIELGPLVDSAVEAVRPACEAKGIELTATLASEPLPVDADATRLAQVIGNLLNNACKFTDSGGRIALDLERAGEEAIIRVHDSGIGMAADQLPRIFDMFVQIDGAAGRSREGLGLGLTLVKQLVEAHGGTVSASSEGIGRGSEIELRLPLTREPAVAAVPGVAWPAGDPHRRVLVVDDNRDGAESLAELLASAGFEVQTAHDGATALTLAAQWRPEVLLLDIGMPGMNGYETARRIRKQRWGRGVLLVALTGWGQAEDLRLSSEAGFNVHLVKPVDPLALMKLLADWLPPPAGAT